MNSQQSTVIFVAITIAAVVYILSRMCKSNKEENLKDQAKCAIIPKASEPEIKVIDNETAKRWVMDAIAKGEKYLFIIPFLNDEGFPYDPLPNYTPLTEFKSLPNSIFNAYLKARDLKLVPALESEGYMAPSPYRVGNLSEGWVYKAFPTTIFGNAGVEAERNKKHVPSNYCEASIMPMHDGLHLMIARRSLSLDAGRVVLKQEDYTRVLTPTIEYKLWHPSETVSIFSKDDVYKTDGLEMEAKFEYIELDVLTPEVIAQLKASIGDQAITSASVYRTAQHMNVEIHYGDKDDMLVVSDVKAFDHYLDYSGKPSGQTVADQLLSRYPNVTSGIHIVDLADRKVTWVKCDGAWTNGLNKEI